MARTDAHSPLNLTTEHYRYEGGYDLGGPNEPSHFSAYCADVTYPPLPPGSDLRDASARCVQTMARLTWSGYWHEREGYGRCDHCGAHIRYGAVLHHLPTGSHIHVGETCLENRFERATADFHAMRKAAQLDREACRVRDAWEAYRRDNLDAATWDALDAMAEANEFVADVLAKGRRYGNLSDRQRDALARAVQRDRERAERRAAYEAAPKAQCPTGRVDVRGTVVSVKLQDSDYGPSWKMLVTVPTQSGSFRLWGTVPRAILNALDAETGRRGNVTDLRGRTVEFAGMVQPSKDDAAFGFYKRPTVAALLPAD